MHCRMADRHHKVRLICCLLVTTIIFPLVANNQPHIQAMPSGGEYSATGGDPNGDGSIDIGDAVYLLNHLFAGGAAPVPCPPTGSGCTNLGGDANGDGLLNIADSVVILDFLFQSGATPVSCPPETPIDDFIIPQGFTFIALNSQGFAEYLHNDTQIEFVKIPSGNFMMGSTSEIDAPFVPGSDESPPHLVTLSSFLIAKMEVSQAEYLLVMGTNPSANVGDDLPVEQISWNEINAPGGFLELTGFTLPTEAQWEYACRGTTTGPFSGTGEIGTMGSYLGNSNGVTSPRGSFEPNSYGLFDMHGNVWEWTRDNYSSTYYSDPCSSALDPIYDEGLAERVVRGGAYNSTATTCRSANRYYLISLVLTNDSVGFRPVLNLNNAP